MRLLATAGVLVACALATGCGSSHHAVLVLKAHQPANAGELDRTDTVLRRRLSLLGVQQASVTTGRDGRITVTTRHALTPAQRRVLTQRGSFAIYDLEADLAPESMNGYAVRASSQPLKAGPQTTAVRCGAACPGAPAAGDKPSWYLFQSNPGQSSDSIPEVTGLDLRRSGIHSAGGAVVLALTPAGERRLREITQTESARGQALHVPQHFAVVVDGALVAAPAVDYKRFPNGVDPKAGVELAGAPKGLAAVLGSGELPLRLAVAR